MKRDRRRKNDRWPEETHVLVACSVLIVGIFAAIWIAGYPALKVDRTKAAQVSK